ncbi:MAG: cell wall hydrolase [Lachnospiraceae bacterium]|nr:cell wall hydrolase [Lachnospiraceae bacterium]
MARSRRLLVALLGIVLSLSLTVQTGMTAQAGSKRNYLDSLNGGVAAILDPSAMNSIGAVNVADKKVTTEKEPESTRVMANVKDALNIRSEADENAKKLGKLYKDCGGTILERRDGWTKLQSGNLIGWAKDEYLLFGEEAENLANSVGKMVAHLDDALRVRKEANIESGVYGILPKGEMVEVVSIEESVEGSIEENKWICINYEGKNGYVSSDYVTLDFLIDTGETLEEIKAREKAEKEAKRHVNYGEYTADADTITLLAALIHCEAGGESYEGQVAVGAVVMNRVRSKAYPNTIHGVIYASGQFTPAMTGKLDRVLESGKIYESCFKAAKEALSGVSNVGDLTHFRRINGREGLIIGNHVFY